MAQLLKTQHDQGASDLHICVGRPPLLRINGDLKPVQVDALEPPDTEELCFSVISEGQKQDFLEINELDFSFSLKGVARYRGNLMRQKGHISGVFRIIPSNIPSLDSLKLPPIISDLCDRDRGLVLVTGATGSGKSTTLAAMVDKINRNYPAHILTLEDPVEFVHNHKKALINQREIGRDSTSFQRALKGSLRQDPDVVLIGELRDLETIQAALTISETGHLVFATLHTNSAPSTISRIIDVFPGEQQGTIRNKLAGVLIAVMCQQLLPNKAKDGRVLAFELMIPNAAIRSLVRESKVHMIHQSMQMGTEKTQMQTLNQHLAQLVTSGRIDTQTAIDASSDVDELTILLQKGGAAGRRM